MKPLRKETAGKTWRGRSRPSSQADGMLVDECSVDLACLPLCSAAVAGVLCGLLRQRRKCILCARLAGGGAGNVQQQYSPRKVLSMMYWHKVHHFRSSLCTAVRLAFSASKRSDRSSRTNKGHFCHPRLRARKELSICLHSRPQCYSRRHTETPPLRRLAFQKTLNTPRTIQTSPPTNTTVTSTVL